MALGERALAVAVPVREVAVVVVAPRALVPAKVAAAISGEPVRWPPLINFFYPAWLNAPFCNSAT